HVAAVPVAEQNAATQPGAAQDLTGGKYVGQVGVGQVEFFVGRAGGHDHGVWSAGQRGLGREVATEVDLDAELRDLALVPIRDLLVDLTIGRHGEEAELPAEALAALVQLDAMAALGGHAGSLEPGRAAAND